MDLYRQSAVRVKRVTGRRWRCGGAESERNQSLKVEKLSAENVENHGWKKRRSVVIQRRAEGR